MFLENNRKILNSHLFWLNSHHFFAPHGQETWQTCRLSEQDKHDQGVNLTKKGVNLKIFQTIMENNIKAAPNRL